jgi:ABC-2 type transport system ATP-binding protein
MPGCVDALNEGADAHIRVTDVVKHFGAHAAVAGARFTVARGETIGLLGSDGAGKTTLLRMMATMIRPSAGQIRINGYDTVGQSARVKASMGYMPQRFGLYQDLTVEENIDFFLDIFGIRGAERRRRKERYLGFSNLLPFLDRPAGALSGGMKQKLGLACVLVNQPELLILDEPTNGVDPISRTEFWEILGEMRAAGMTIMVSTAYMDEGERCDRLILMHAGRILAMLPPAELVADEENLEAAMIRRIEAADPKLAEGGFES